LCLQEPGCSVRTNWRSINRMVLEALDRITLEQMAQPIGRTLTIAMPAARKPLQSSGQAASGRMAGAES
jgi:DNA-binding IscR family transcriptional regulator